MIFLSASIPSEDRDRKYFETADVIAIRDAVRALATVVVPFSKLVWGGHPAITPLIRYIMKRMDYNLKEHVTLYQSNFFKDHFPKDNFDFEDIKIIQENIDRESSLSDMRIAMIRENDFQAGVFIGGMEGVEQEYELFKKFHPKALMLPVASTGAAARIIYNDLPEPRNIKLNNEYAYMSLFKTVLKDILHRNL